MKDPVVPKPHTIALAEDHAILRQGLRSLLEKTGEFEVVAEASDGLEAIRRVGETLPDILIIDLAMPRLTGMDAIREIKRLHDDIKIIVLTVHAAEEYVYESLKAGADGYVLKAADYTELITAIKTVLSGKIYLSPDISDTVVMGYLKGGARQGNGNRKGEPHPARAGGAQTGGRGIQEPRNRRSPLRERQDGGKTSRKYQAQARVARHVGDDRLRHRARPRQPLRGHSTRTTVPFPFVDSMEKAP